ncbi:hypothetical protein [Hyphococcus sp.]|uniref:hypothetical protein n=1 Tax=Hyphococcus sp. TaxID=2038636 RepID=UPI00208A0C4E|nr:MAG: hypothetical protein DHS20C04_13140 [Marinicaulis sp.]
MQKKLFGACAFGLMYAGATAMAQDVAPPKTCDYGTMHPNAPAETEQFAFLIGDYKVTFHAWQGESWSPPQPGVTARWNGYYGLGGMAIIDEWFHPDPAQDPNSPRGINVRMYDKEAGEWDMMWVATGANQVQDLRAKVIDDVLTMWQVYPDRANFQATFHIDDKDHWSRVAYTKGDNGEWVKTFKLAATRIPCDG